MKSIFKGKDGEALLDWVMENGHIGSVINPVETEVAEHNLMIRLLSDAGYGLEVVKAKPAKEEEKNLIDDNLEHTYGQVG